ncbi:UPF0692 protein C19orf54 homolog isoform X2 [Carcharodon carcharias]|uniref:UPF0692 protein C19orf54 homolog isoform X2 n=1 Tax=Carcharodon carcharias TaxID=13397 RepID=UPI001B7F083B|nr:UPF0692 protein C19orf54 homolog isoform X2 [Carcharodon carcharias]
MSNLLHIGMAQELGGNPSEDKSDGSEWSRMPPPPPPPLPPPPPFLAPTSVPSKKKLYQLLAGQRLPVIGDREEVKMLLQNRPDSFSKELNWLLINKYVPSLIQDGPQCGLVALWMAGHLLNTCEVRDLEEIVGCAKARGYTVQGEMFSGVLLGLKCGLPEDFYEEDPDIPGLFHRRANVPGAGYPEDCVVETHLLAKQGKSLKYQLWQYEQVHKSNMQLTEFSPKREYDGTVYVVPDGGVESGLCGAVILLQPLSQEQDKS